MRPSRQCWEEIGGIADGEAGAFARGVQVTGYTPRGGPRGPHRIAEDNVQDWWEPLTDVPVDQINAVQLAINAKEGAARAHGALLLLRQAVDVAGALERSVYALRIQKAEAE